MTIDRRTRPPKLWVAAGLCAAIGVLALSLNGGLAGAIESRLAGSAQLDYLAVPTQRHPRDVTLDGFTTELSLKLAVDVTKRINASIKVCSSCHGLETGVAAVDIALSDAITLHAGRFTPSFGDFPDRHDPANHRTSDKPLPYDMGRMLRMREWNMSVLPAPFVDNGVQVLGHHSISDALELDWAAYLVSGLRASSGASDIDFMQSRSGERYYVDNNSQPTVGGRASMIMLGDRTSLKLGVSAMVGTGDPERKLDYLLLGVDVVAKLGNLTVRAEYLLRRQRMGFGPSPATEYVYGPGSTGGWDPYFLKDGFYVVAQWPVGNFDLLARFDGMGRVGNVPVGSALKASSTIVRSTLAASWRMDKRLRWKASAEWYQYSDFADDVALHLGVVTAF